MEIYLTIITTALVITQILRLIQNAMQLRVTYKRFEQEFFKAMEEEK